MRGAVGGWGGQLQTIGCLLALVQAATSVYCLLFHRRSIYILYTVLITLIPCIHPLTTAAIAFPIRHYLVTGTVADPAATPRKRLSD